MEDACSHASTRTELTGDRIYYSHVEYAVDRSFVCAHMESRMNRVITRGYTYIYISFICMISFVICYCLINIDSKFEYIEIRRFLTFWETYDS